MISVTQKYRIYSSISHTFLYLKISPKTGVRLILEASEMTCSYHHKVPLILMKTWDYLICVIQRRYALT